MCNYVDMQETMSHTQLTSRYPFLSTAMTCGFKRSLQHLTSYCKITMLNFTKLTA